MKKIKRPTPETDAESFWPHYSKYKVCDVEFARKLERERNELREKAERYRIEANSIMLQRDEARSLTEHQWLLKVGSRLFVAGCKSDGIIDSLDEIIRERDEARDVLEEISLYLSSGIGDENTTAQQYKERILDGVKHLAGHAWEERCKFERERDESREALKHIGEYGTEEINAAIDLRQKLASALVERDEARSELSLKQQTLTIAEGTLSDLRKQRDEWSAMCGRYKQERDIAEQDATNYHARIIELIAERDKTKQERDETREKAERYRIEANSIMLQRDELRDKYDTLATEHMLVVNKLCKERDDALKGNQ